MSGSGKDTRVLSGIRREVTNFTLGMGINRMKKQRDIFSIRQKKNPAIFTYCDIIYTKAYRFEISGEEQVSGRMPWEIVNTN